MSSGPTYESPAELNWFKTVRFRRITLVLLEQYFRLYDMAAVKSSGQIWHFRSDFLLRLGLTMEDLYFDHSHGQNFDHLTAVILKL